jgi:hypothetical protein
MESAAASSPGDWRLMPSKNPQSINKRNREAALREKRERKREKKAQRREDALNDTGETSESEEPVEGEDAPVEETG